MAWRSIRQQQKDEFIERDLEADDSNRAFKVPTGSMEKFICASGHVWEEDIGDIINTVNEEVDDPEYMSLETDLLDICTEGDIECPECGTCYFIPLKAARIELEKGCMP
jgi:hypothetical protein